MAAIIIDATKVKPGGGLVDRSHVVFDGTIAGSDGSTTQSIELTGGMAIYLDQVALQWRLAQADTLAHLGWYLGRGARLGIVQNNTSYPGQPVDVYTGGDVTYWDQLYQRQGGPGIVFNATLSSANLQSGQGYVVSPFVAGEIRPDSDLSTNHLVARLGVGFEFLGPITFNPTESGAIGAGLVGQMENLGILHY